MEYTILNNGINIPMLGLGTFMISPEDCEIAVYEAIKIGYRLIDTANAYLNEEAVGKAIAKAIQEGIVKREDLFISSKLWPTLYENPDAVDNMLKRLGLTYVDLLFIHQPAGNYLAGYKEIEKAYHTGKARSLGISNMHGNKLNNLLDHAAIKPQVIQLEAHPYCTEKEIMSVLKPYGTKLMGWYPLGHGDKELFEEEIFKKLSAKYNKTVVQIILRWHIESGFLTIPGSKNIEHIKNNFEIFDFALSNEEMQEIAKLDGKKKYYNPTSADEERYASYHLPLETEPN